MLAYSEWGALFAPQGTPPDIINKLNAAVVEALADPVVRSRSAARHIYQAEQPR